MNRTPHPTPCIICGAPTHLVSHAIVAPWIREMASQQAQSASDLVGCRECGIHFFSYRYGEQVLEALYGDYRGDQYVSIRRRWEPWYRSAVNTAFEGGSPATQERVEFMGRLLSLAGAGPFDTAVDVGGDEGQFFPAAATGQRIVIEVSGKPLPAGVTSAPTLQDVGTAPDLISICHVLEHITDPVSMLREARGILRTDGWLYIEVPLDLPRTRPFHRSDTYAQWLEKLPARRPFFVTADFVTGVSRQYQRRIPRRGVVKQSEHINYFGFSSLEAALSKSGFQVVVHEADPRASVGGLRLGRIGVVARPCST